MTYDRKRGRADLEDLLMEGFQREGTAFFLFICIPEVFEGQVAHIIAQIVGRSFQKYLVKCPGGRGLKAEFSKCFCDIFFGKTMIMDRNVHKSRQPQSERTVQAIELRQVRICVRQTIGIHFHIGGPAFDVAAEIQKAPYRI